MEKTAMTKEEIRKAINEAYKATIHHASLSNAHKEGMRNFKLKVVDYIHALYIYQNSKK